MLFGQELNSHRVFKRQAKALTILRVCAGWSEPLLVAHTILLEISCCGSIIIFCAVCRGCIRLKVNSDVTYPNGLEFTQNIHLQTCFILYLVFASIAGWGESAYFQI